VAIGRFLSPRFAIPDTPDRVVSQKFTEIFLPLMRKAMPGSSDPVHIRHPDVEEHHIRHFCFQQVKSSFTASSLKHPVPLPFHQDGKEGTQALVTVDDKNFRDVIFHRPRLLHVTAFLAVRKFRKLCLARPDGGQDWERSRIEESLRVIEGR
jgi:hypothetical protein